MKYLKRIFVGCCLLGLVFFAGGQTPKAESATAITTLTFNGAILYSAAGGSVGFPVRKIHVKFVLVIPTSGDKRVALHKEVITTDNTYNCHNKNTQNSEYCTAGEGWDQWGYIVKFVIPNDKIEKDCNNDIQCVRGAYQKIKLFVYAEAGAVLKDPEGSKRNVYVEGKTIDGGILKRTEYNNDYTQSTWDAGIDMMVGFPTASGGTSQVYTAGLDGYNWCHDTFLEKWKASDGN